MADQDRSPSSRHSGSLTNSLCKDLVLWSGQPNRVLRHKNAACLARSRARHAWIEPGMQAKKQRRQTESLMKHIHKRGGWVGRCETCERLSKRSERVEEANNDPECLSHSPSPRPAKRPPPPGHPRPRCLALCRFYLVSDTQLNLAAPASADMVHARALDEHRCA
jgi:hypothetical protein